MAEIKLGMVEARFADLVWENEPLTTKELVAFCENELNWKRTTTYTPLSSVCLKEVYSRMKTPLFLL